MGAVLVTGAFDDLGLRHVRLLHEASRVGPVIVHLWSDEEILAATGAEPKFLLAERRYLAGSLRWVSAVALTGEAHPKIDRVCVDVDGPKAEVSAAGAAAAALHADLRELTARELSGIPELPLSPPDASRRRVVVTGCYDWLHSGHVRFFEEVAGYGELYVVVGHDANVRLLKGEGHPRFPMAQRRYMTGSVRHVHGALVSTGSGWMDAEPEIRSIGAHIYAVNEDGDKPEKREFCRTHGLEYLVLHRVPAAGLPRRSSTDLRGF